MEGRNDWYCDCGYVCSPGTGYVWENPDGKTLRERNHNEVKESSEYQLLTDENFDYYINYLKYCKEKKLLPESFKGYVYSLEIY
jgi:hypothetical protein